MKKEAFITYCLEQVKSQHPYLTSDEIAEIGNYIGILWGDDKGLFKVRSHKLVMEYVNKMKIFSMKKQKV